MLEKTYENINRYDMFTIVSTVLSTLLHINVLEKNT